MLSYSTVRFLVLVPSTPIFFRIIPLVDALGFLLWWCDCDALLSQTSYFRSGPETVVPVRLVQYSNHHQMSGTCSPCENNPVTPYLDWRTSPRRGLGYGGLADQGPCKNVAHCEVREAYRTI